MPANTASSFRPARCMRRGTKALGLATLAAASGLTPAAHAATYNGGTDNLWGNAANWSPGIPASGEDVIIADTTSQNSLSLNDAAHTVGLLQYGTTGTRTTPQFTISAANGNVLTLTNGLTANGAHGGTGSGSVSLLIGAPITVQGDQTWSVAGQIGSAVTDSGVSINTPTTGTAIPLVLNGKITKTGSGQLLITGRNVGDGSIDVNAGALKLNAGSSTLLTVNGTGTITVNSGASLFISRNSGTFNLTKAIAINTGGVLSVGGNLANGSYNIDSPIAFTGATTLNTNTGAANEVINLTGKLTGTGTITTTVSSSGTGRAIVLSGDNSGLAAHIVNVQTIAVGTDTALGTGVYRADTNSVLRSADTNTRTINNVVDLASNTTFGSAGTGELIFTATATQLGSNGNNNTGIATGNGAKTITVNNARTTISGKVTDSGAATANALTKAGPGILVFSGPNTYNRPTVITAGTLQVTGSGQIGVNSSANTRTVTVQDNGLLQLDVAGLSDFGTLDVTSTDSAAEVAIGTGVNDTVNGLIVNGVPMAPGTYGSTASGAANPTLANPDDVFSGAGVLTVTSLAVVPEPATLGLAGVLLAGAITGRRRRHSAAPAN